MLRLIGEQLVHIRMLEDKLVKLDELNKLLTNLGPIIDPDVDAQTFEEKA